jgi:hypothetical protein
MAVSRNPGQTGSTRTVRRLFDRLSRYDLLLAVVPLGFLCSVLAHVLTAIPFQWAVASGALLGLAVTVDALFVHPPTENPPRSSQ